MKGEGIRKERETVIVWNEEDDTATIWTASEPVYRRLLKVGYFPAEDGDRHARFVVEKRRVKLPRPLSKAKSEATKARMANLRRVKRGKMAIPEGI